MSASSNPGTKKVALVAGATGVVGSALVDALLAAPEYARVIALARRPRAEPPPEELEWRVVDFDRLESELEGLRVDVVFCALGTTRKQAGSAEAFQRVDRDYVLAVGRAGRAAGAECFVLCSSVGADPTASNLYLRTKGEAEAGIADLGYPRVEIMQPSLLLAERPERRWGEELAAVVLPAVSRLLVGPARRYRPISAERVAAAMLGAARREGTGVSVHLHDALLRLDGRGAE